MINNRLSDKECIALKEEITEKEISAIIKSTLEGIYSKEDRLIIELYKKFTKI